MRTHTLKTWPVFFEKVLSNEKTFELRKNDRNFQVGDVLKLEEYDRNHPTTRLTGRACYRKVTYLTDGKVLDTKDDGVLLAGYVIMAIRLLNSDELRELILSTETSIL